MSYPSYPSTPMLTLGLSTDESLHLDLSIDPLLCAIHRGSLDGEALTMTVQHPLLDGPTTVSICRSCLLEHAPKALEALTT